MSCLISVKIIKLSSFEYKWDWLQEKRATQASSTEREVSIRVQQRSRRNPRALFIGARPSPKMWAHSLDFAYLYITSLLCNYSPFFFSVGQFLCSLVVSYSFVIFTSCPTAAVWLFQPLCFIVCFPFGELNRMGPSHLSEADHISGWVWVPILSFLKRGKVTWSKAWPLALNMAMTFHLEVGYGSEGIIRFTDN